LIVNSINERVKYAVEKSTIKGFDLYLPLTSTILHFEKLNMISVFSNEYTMGYAQVLVKGKISLYASRMLEHIGTTADLEKYFTYILIRDDGKMFHFIHYSRRSLSKLFPGEKENYNLQLCKLHNKVRNEQQLIQAVGLFNILNK